MTALDSYLELFTFSISLPIWHTGSSLCFLFILQNSLIIEFIQTAQLGVSLFIYTFKHVLNKVLGMLCILLHLFNHRPCRAGVIMADLCKEAPNMAIVDISVSTGQMLSLGVTLPASLSHCKGSPPCNKPEFGGLSYCL